MSGEFVKHGVKRVMDVIVAIALLIVLSPVLFLTWTLVRLRLGAPAIFVQLRPGQWGVPFPLYKFRTMTDATDADGNLLADGDRLTPLGSSLRRWSLDETPELWNVVRGDMSLVGPRPLLLEYLELYDEEQMQRHRVRPGMTGLAQVKGRNDQTWDERLALDAWYAANWSLWLDVRILAETLVRVVTGDGVTAQGHATMPRFEGTRRG